MTSKHFFLLIFSITIGTISTSCQPDKETDVPGWHDEIIYHLFQRSFYDSNGDHHGDLNGVVDKLEYFTDLGVTAILFTPLYESDFYHNYFPIDYESIDPEYGTFEDYIRFIKAVHSKGLKFIMDMETQYVQNGNLWLEDSYKNLNSEYSDYIYYTDSLNQIPGSVFGGFQVGFPTLPAWPDQQLRIAMLNLNHDAVKNWMVQFYTYWVDPNGDGRFDDGVDGFRIDHIMDDLDYLGVFKNLYADFWKPIFDSCRSVNPDIFIIGEQSDWGTFGEDMVRRSTADACFGFPIRFAISGAPTMYMGGGGKQEYLNAFRVYNIHQAVEETLKRLPEHTYFLNFIENHDMDRWASAMNGHEGKIRCAAVLNLLLPGIPSLYYGQELGVTGRVGNWGHDGNHIPIREAFPWSSDPDDIGMAVWYQNTGPWWDQSYFITGGAQNVSLSLQKENPGSLWNFFRHLINIRKEHTEFQKGVYIPLMGSDSSLLAFARETDNGRSVTIINVSEELKTIDLALVNAVEYETILEQNTKRDGHFVKLEPYSCLVLAK